MKNLILKKPLFYFLNLLLLIFFFTIWSCSDSDTFIEVITDNIEDNEINDNNPMEDDQSNEEEDMDNDQMDDNQTSDENACTNPEDFTFLERNGLVFVEFENTVITEDWELATNEPNFTGDGYLVWNGAQSLGRPGNGIMTFRINIETTGTYQFIWNSAVLTGDNGTEHNDTWLRFNDADDFFGKRGESIVYPADTGKTPTPEGASADGWFKIYRSGNNLEFKWQSKTSDNDAHDIFVTFNEPGIYIMEVSARSSSHAIDKFVLFNESYSVSEATDENNIFSAINCN